MTRERVGARALRDPHIDGGASRCLRGGAERCARCCAEVLAGVERSWIGAGSSLPELALVRVVVRGQP